MEFSIPKYWSGCTVNVSQLVDQLLPTPAVCRLNSVIGKLLKNIYSLLTLSKIRKQRKRGGELSNFQKNIALVSEVTAVPTCATTTAPTFCLFGEIGKTCSTVNLEGFEAGILSGGSDRSTY